MSANNPIRFRTVIVTGGRNYQDTDTLTSVLDFINPDVVIQGGASGADLHALVWAKLNKKKYITYEADWKAHGRAAGPMRNKMMIQSHHMHSVLIAFPGTSGTKNCIETAKRFNMIIMEIK